MRSVDAGAYLFRSPPWLPLAGGFPCPLVDGWLPLWLPCCPAPATAAIIAPRPGCCRPEDYLDRSLTAGFRSARLAGLHRYPERRRRLAACGRRLTARRWLASALVALRSAPAPWPLVDGCAPPCCLVEMPSAVTVWLSIRPLAWKPCCRWNTINACLVRGPNTPSGSPLEEALLLQDDLHLPDFLHAQAHRCAAAAFSRRHSAARAGAVDFRRGPAHRHDRDDR